MYPIPTISELSTYSGRDEATYNTAVANTALLQATLRFTIVTEISDPAQINGYMALSQADMQLLAKQGILSLADSIYLQFPYQQAQASPFNSETLGGYTYQKNSTFGMGGSMSRLAPAALELSLDTTGIPLFDLAVRTLARRTLAAGIFHEGMSLFEEGERKSAMGASMFTETTTGRRWILGPEDHNNFVGPVFGGDVNGQMFPQDPGI